MNARWQSFLCVAFAAVWMIGPIPAVSGNPADIVVETIERSFTLQGRPVLWVKNADGRIRVVAGNQPQVQIRAIKEVHGVSGIEDARQYAARVEVRIEQSGNRIRAEAIYPSGIHLSFGRQPEPLVHFEITVPKGSDLEAVNGDGELQAEGLEGNIKVQTGDGGLSLTNCAGRIESQTGDGDLRIQGVRGEVSAKTGDGSITLDGVLEALEARSGDGRIRIKALSGSRVTREWSIQSGDGDIRISLPESLAANLDVSTSDGQIRVEYPVTVEKSRSEHKLAGKLNGGGNSLRIQSGDGDITIEKP